MTARRREIMKELGLAPRWRLRAKSKGVAPLPPIPAGSTSTMEPALALDERTTQIIRMDWPQLKESVAGCVACPLHRGRNKTVFGVGDESASWLFVGEGPGAEEDLKGEPFVGQAGKLLDNMLAAIKLKRGKDVYIANIVKCRPPMNRDPQEDEIATCFPFLEQQIGIIAPQVIVSLGKVAAHKLLGISAPIPKFSITRIRGKFGEYNGIPVMPTFHPAYLLRNPRDKWLTWEDAQSVIKKLETLDSGT